jgi:dienelactone hydrolase
VAEAADRGYNPRMARLAFTFLAMTVTAFPPADQLPAQPELPEPLVMLDGRRVTTREQWEKDRRPELKELFQHYMYGYLPRSVPVLPTLQRSDNRALGGKATLQEIALAVVPYAPPIHLLLVTPNQGKGPFPVAVGMNFAGNHAVLADPAIAMPTAWVPGKGPVARGSQVNVWAIEQSIDRGWAVATFYCGDVDPDRADKREGIQPHIARLGMTHPGDDDWGTIGAWAWGIQRVVDYLQGAPHIDRNRIAVVGHSRLGKTALVAAAFDDRIALAWPHQAGCGGTAPSRSHNAKAETVKMINKNFPHWFDANFKQFDDHPDRLPFDQNCLEALCAPRPVLVTAATEDQHANPAGMIDVLKAADPAYRLYGVDGFNVAEMPSPGAVVGGRLGYYLRTGKHAMTADDWKVFLDFADKQLKEPRTK